MAKAEVASAKNLYGILSTGCFCYVMQVLSFFSLIFSLPPKLKLLRPFIVVIIFMFMRSVGVLESFLVEASGHSRRGIPLCYKSESIHEFKFEKRRNGWGISKAPGAGGCGLRAFAMVLCSGP